MNISEITQRLIRGIVEDDETPSIIYFSVTGYQLARAEDDAPFTLAQSDGSPDDKYLGLPYSIQEQDLTLQVLSHEHFERIRPVPTTAELLEGIMDTMVYGLDDQYRTKSHGVPVVLDQKIVRFVTVNDKNYRITLEAK